MLDIAWASTTKTKLKKIYSQQKQAIKTVFNEDILSPSKELFNELRSLRESILIKRDSPELNRNVRHCMGQYNQN